MSSVVEAKQKSVFDTKSLKTIYKEIQDLYLSDKKPWIIGYSGGKDSTTALQLIWYAIKDLPNDKRKKSIFVISSDTFVETPYIINYINSNLERINNTSKKEGLPFSAHKVNPLINDSYWVNLIGRGYPAPSKMFRWCTERMKIRPADKFILDKVSEFGEAILVLGVRKSESMSRSQVMSLYKIKDTQLSRHSKFPGAFVYTPIEDFDVDDVWTYLLQTPNPWGSNNRDLAAMYSNASDSKECPLVIDDKTPSCGDSRFGCWVCTLVQKDKTMEALIDSGEEWMAPLLEIRDLLALTQDPEKKYIYRSYKRRSGAVTFKSDGSGVISRGPYKLEFCKKLFRKVLEAQKKVRSLGPDPHLELIKPDEIHEIRKLWKLERGDWEDSIPKIYREVMNSDLDWVIDDVGSFSNKESKLLSKIALRYGIPPKLVMRLLDIELQLYGMERRASIYKNIEKILNEEWRSEEEIMEEIKQGSV